MDPFESFRHEFPVYRECVYVNHAAVSPHPVWREENMEAWWQSRAHSPVDVYPGIVKTRDAMLDGIGRLIGTSRRDRIALLTNTSQGLNIVASGLEWKAGDRILLNRAEFPANIYPFLHLERLGVRIDWLDVPDGLVTPEAVEHMLHRRTRLVALSHVQFLHGTRADLATIGTLCRERGILLVVDGIQGVGVAPMDVEEWGIDALACGGHKWLMWPMGVAFLYLSEQMMEAVTPAHVGWLSVQNAWDLFNYRLELLEDAGRFELGTQNWMGITLAAPMLERFLELGVDHIHGRVLETTGYLMDGLSDAGFDLVTPRDDDQRAGIVTIRIEEAPAVLDHLSELGVHAAVREGLVRFAPHCANNRADMDQIVDAMIKWRED